MILRKINEYEAILEPYFDGGDSDMRFGETKCSALRHYTCKTDAPELVRAVQNWSAVEVEFDNARPEGTEFTMTRECSMEIGEYDTFRLYGAIPSCIHVTMLVKQNGSWREAAEFDGNDTTYEHDAPLDNACLEGFGFRFRLTEQKPATAVLHYVELLEIGKEKAYCERKSIFPPDWEDHMKKEGEFKPELGLWFDEGMLDALRKKVHSPALNAIYRELLKQAEDGLKSTPEADIGRFVPSTDRRWVATRDLGKQVTANLMAVMAFVGLMEERADMMKMAVRMALSVSNCEYWCESIMGVLPGCSWHHRSFTEEIYARGVALVLDWAGGFLTAYGKTCLVDALVMKALPRMESDYRRMEYIRHMNQGICFNWGRLTALLALQHYYPRYDIRIDDAERDLREMIDSYVLPDGGTMEGPGYWSYTFSQAMPQFYLLSRYRGSDFLSYSTPNLLKTGEYALSMLSIQGRGNRETPINDAHSGTYAPLLMAAYQRMSGKEDYARVLAATLAEGEVTPSVELMILLPDELPAEAEYRQRGFYHFPALGQTRIIRELDGVGAVSFFLSGGAAHFGHYHCDKGAFILETEREALALDRGVTNYSHPDTKLLQLPGYHNLAYPELADGSLLMQNGNQNGCGAKLLETTYENGVFRTATDTTGAWVGNVVEHSERRVESASAAEYILTDELTLSEALPVSFRVNTHAEAEIKGDCVILHGISADLKIEPEDWKPVEITAVPESIDEHLEKVTLVRLVHAAAKEHTFRTKLTLLKK